MNWDQLYFETYTEMDCNDLESVVAGHRGFRPHQLRKRTEKKHQVCAELDSFKRAIAYRPATLEEAISRRQNEIVSSMPMIAGWIAWQLVKWLVVEVFKIAWKKYTEQQNELAAGKVK